MASPSAGPPNRPNPGNGEGKGILRILRRNVSKATRKVSSNIARFLGGPLVVTVPADAQAQSSYSTSSQLRVSYGGPDVRPDQSPSSEQQVNDREPDYPSHLSQPSPSQQQADIDEPNTQAQPSQPSPSHQQTDLDMHPRLDSLKGRLAQIPGTRQQFSSDNPPPPIMHPGQPFSSEQQDKSDVPVSPTKPTNQADGAFSPHHRATSGMSKPPSMQAGQPSSIHHRTSSGLSLPPNFQPGQPSSSNQPDNSSFEQPVLQQVHLPSTQSQNHPANGINENNPTLICLQCGYPNHSESDCLNRTKYNQQPDRCRWLACDIHYVDRKAPFTEFPAVDGRFRYGEWCVQCEERVGGYDQYEQY